MRCRLVSEREEERLRKQEEHRLQTQRILAEQQAQIKKRMEEMELAEAKVTDKDEMESVLIHGRAQIFEIEELKIILGKLRGMRL